MNSLIETDDNRMDSGITVSLGADVSEGYVLRFELHHAEHFDFTSMTLGLETPQQLGERLAAQVIATLDAREDQPDRIACDLYPKFPTTYAAEVLADHYQVPMLRMQKCHGAIVVAMDGLM